MAQPALRKDRRALPPDWAGEDVHALLGEVRGGTIIDRRQDVLRFDWADGDLSHLGWMMAQKGVDLGTALRVFLNGMPERWNYVPPRQLTESARARCRVLDAIHRRIVAGFYLPDPEQGVGPVRAEMMDWIARQEGDRARGRVGRWLFKAELLEPLTLASTSPTDIRDVLDPAAISSRHALRRSLWRDLLAPILG